MIARISSAILLVTVAISVAQNIGNLTHYCSYAPCCHNTTMDVDYTPAELSGCKGTIECTKYSACDYQGQFQFSDDLPHSEVVNTNIISFFTKHDDIKKYKNKMIKVTQGEHSIIAKAIDTCADKDCKNCCTENAGESGYLIDMESNTYARFGGKDGVVTWECMNCKN